MKIIHVVQVLRIQAQVNQQQQQDETFDGDVPF